YHLFFKIFFYGILNEPFCRPLSRGKSKQSPISINQRNRRDQGASRDFVGVGLLLLSHQTDRAGSTGFFKYRHYPANHLKPSRSINGDASDRRESSTHSYASLGTSYTRY